MTTIGEMVGRFACPVCAKRFHQLGDKKRHVKRNHPKR